MIIHKEEIINGRKKIKILNINEEKNKINIFTKVFLTEEEKEIYIKNGIETDILIINEYETTPKIMGYKNIKHMINNLIEKCNYEIILKEDKPLIENN